MKNNSLFFLRIFTVLMVCVVMLLSCNKGKHKFTKKNTGTGYGKVISDTMTEKTILNDSVVNDSILFSNTGEIKKTEDTTYISLVFKLYDSVKKHSETDLLIIGKCTNNQYTPFEDVDIKSLKGLKSSKTFELLKRNRNFSAFKNGRKIADYKIIGATSELFSCSSLAVGIANNLKLLTRKRKNNSNHGFKGYSKGKKVDIAFKNYIAKNNDSTNPKSYHSNVLKFKMNANQLEDLKTIMMKGYIDSMGIKKIENKDLRLTARRITKMRDTCLIVTYHHDTESFCLSSIHVIKYQNKVMTDLLKVNNTNALDAWGAGYSLFDVLDIDGDGTNELIFEVGYYESTGFEIYKLINNQFKQVLSVVPWGC
jgi:hypothetical protein